MIPLLLSFFFLATLSAQGAAPSPFQKLDHWLATSNLDAAEAALSSELKKNPKDLKLLSKKALLLFQKGEEEKLYALMKSLHQKNPKDVELAKSLLGLAFSLKKEEEVGALLADLAEKDSKNRRIIFALFGWLMQQNRYADAAKTMEGYSKRNQSDPEALQVLALAHLLSGRLDQAKTAILQAEKQSPLDAKGLLLKGHILAALKDCRRAILSYQAALSKGLDRAVVPLALCASQRGDYQLVAELLPELQAIPQAPHLALLKELALLHRPPNLSLDTFYQSENNLLRRTKTLLTLTAPLKLDTELRFTYDRETLHHISFGTRRFQRTGFTAYSVLYPLAISFGADSFNLSGGDSTFEGRAQLAFLRRHTTFHLGVSSEQLTEGLRSLRTLTQKFREKQVFFSLTHTLKDKSTALTLTVASSRYSDGNKRRFIRGSLSLPLVKKMNLQALFSLTSDKFDFKSPFYFSEPQSLTGNIALFAEQTFSTGTHVQNLFSASRLQTPGREKKSDTIEWIIAVDQPLSPKLTLTAGYHGNSAPIFFYQVFHFGVKTAF